MSPTQYWLLFGSLALLGSAQTVACTSEFSSCEARRSCPVGGAAGMAGAAGAAGAGTGGAKAGAHPGGSSGLEAQAGEAGTADDAGAGGAAGDSNVDTELAIAEPALATGKTYVPFTGKLRASGAAHYTWSVTSGALPAGLSLQGAQTATVTIAGTPTEAGQFPLSLSVTDGSTTKAVDVILVITHSALFLSDRNVAGVNELFLAEIGAGETPAPVRLSASFPSGGGVASYAWSPDGSKVLYLASQSSGGAAELWVASLAAPGTAQRVSAPGVTVSQMVWLRSGNVAAYSTSDCETALVDLSGSVPGASKVAIPASPCLPRSLTPSPNGNALAVTSVAAEMDFSMQIAYVTWNAGLPKSVPFGNALSYGGYSYDGRYVLSSSSGIGSWTDLSLPSLTEEPLGHSFSGAWSPNAEALLWSGGDLGGSDVGFVRDTFDSGKLTSTVLVPAGTCKGMSVFPWSPDGKNGVFACDRDLRGVSNVATAAVSVDFSLLPSGFSTHSFTDILSVGWSPDSKWIAVRADRDVDTQVDLNLLRWSAPGVLYKPHANSTASGVTTWAFAPNSRSVAFVGTIAPQLNTGLYLSQLPASGAPPTATLISAPASAVVQTDINWLPGSRVLAYRATVSGAAQLFAVPIAADGTVGSVIPISGVSGSGVSSYQLAPTR